jgi:hypothetical protein
MLFFLGVIVGLITAGSVVAALPKTIWHGSPRVLTEGVEGYVLGIQIGFRDDGVVTWRITPKEKRDAR